MALAIGGGWGLPLGRPRPPWAARLGSRHTRRRAGRLLWTERDQKHREVCMLRECFFDSGEGLIILIPLHRLHAWTHRHVPPRALLMDAWRHDLERRTAGMLIFDIFAHRLDHGL